MPMNVTEAGIGTNIRQEKHFKSFNRLLFNSLNLTVRSTNMT